MTSTIRGEWACIAITWAARCCPRRCGGCGATSRVRSTLAIPWSVRSGLRNNGHLSYDAGNRKACSRGPQPAFLRSRTMKIRFAWIVAATLIVAASAPVLAHHSFAAEFDANKPVTLTGSLTKLDWINPHARLFIDVKGSD